MSTTESGLSTDLVKAALKRYVKFTGETDSEVAAQLLATVGPKQFGRLVDYGGVFLSLNKNGELWSVKTSGSLEMLETKYGQLLASTLPESLRPESQDEGWMRFSDKGELLDGKSFKRVWKKGMYGGSCSTSPSSPMPHGPFVHGIPVSSPCSQSQVITSPQRQSHISPATPKLDW